MQHLPTRHYITFSVSYSQFDVIKHKGCTSLDVCGTQVYFSLHRRKEEQLVNTRPDGKVINYKL